LATTLDSLGPIARTVDDAALLAAVMSGHDPRDEATLSAPAIDFAGALAAEPDVRGMRVTAPPVEQFTSPVEPDVLRARAEAIDVLRALGASVEEIRAPFDFEDLMLRNGRIIAAEAYSLHRGYIEDPSLEIDPWVRKRTVGGKSISAADYIDEIAARRATVGAFADWMRGREALLTPTLPIVAPPIDQADEATTPLATFTRAANYLGACALTLPAGFSSEGLPIGAQLIGAPFADATLVRMGRAFQRATDWHLRRPDLSGFEGS
jgi:aspartyl-tRNA(Asn)/glutamyl-tRNA(Gln) amidotransferase subunit A